MRPTDGPRGTPQPHRASIAVPANQLLVVTSESERVDLPTGQHLYALEITTQAPNPTTQYLTLPYQTSLSDDYYGGMQNALIYADPGTNVEMHAFRNTSVSIARVDVVISGYLVDCDAGSGCPLP